MCTVARTSRGKAVVAFSLLFHTITECSSCRKSELQSTTAVSITLWPPRSLRCQNSGTDTQTNRQTHTHRPSNVIYATHTHWGVYTNKANRCSVLLENKTRPGSGKEVTCTWCKQCTTADHWDGSVLINELSWCNHVGRPHEWIEWCLSISMCFLHAGICNLVNIPTSPNTHPRHVGYI